MMVAFFDRWWDEVRPLMINEQAAIDKERETKRNKQERIEAKQTNKKKK